MFSENIKMTESAGGFLPAGKGFVRGVLIAAIVTILAFAVFACLLAYTGLPESAIPVIALVTEGAGAFISGFCAAKSAKSRGFMMGLIAGALYMGLIWLISVLSGSGFHPGSHLLTMSGVSLGFGGLGGIFGVNMTPKVTNKRKR